MKWQPIETAPVDYGHPHYFLIYTRNQNTLMGMGMEGEICYLTAIDGITNNAACYGEITHWMPLPPPPKED